MARLRSTTLMAAAGVLLAAMTLTGCGGSGPAASAKPSGSSTPTAAPSPTPTPTTAAADVLFTIQANVRGKAGDTITVRMTARKPLPYSDRDAKPLISAFVSACGAGVGGNPITADTLAANGSILMPIDLSSSAQGKTFSTPIGLSLGSRYTGQSVKGAGIANSDPGAGCLGGYTWATSGSASVVSDFESGTPGPELGSWRYGLFGFSVPFDSDATIEACTVTITELAKDADVASVTGWDPTQASTGKSCGLGYSGE